MGAQDWISRFNHVYYTHCSAKARSENLMYVAHSKELYLLDPRCQAADLVGLIACIVNKPIIEVPLIYNLSVEKPIPEPPYSLQLHAIWV